MSNLINQALEFTEDDVAEWIEGHDWWKSYKFEDGIIRDVNIWTEDDDGEFYEIDYLIAVYDVVYDKEQEGYVTDVSPSATASFRFNREVVYTGEDKC